MSGAFSQSAPNLVPASHAVFRAEKQPVDGLKSSVGTEPLPSALKISADALCILIWSGFLGPGGNAANAGVDTPSAGALRGGGGRMKLLSKEVFLRHQNKRPPATGFVTYISKTQPTLMHCHGWQDYSDGYDDYSVSVSHDNGKTWSPEEVRWKSRVVPEGRI